MKHNSIQRVTAVLMSLSLLPAPTFAGSASSGGASNMWTSDENNPYFLGAESIPYCIEVGPDFPISRQEVAKTIARSFQDWKAIFEKYGLYQKVLPGEFVDQIKRSVTVDAREIPTCDKPAHQLQFKIGVIDSDVSSYLRFEGSDRIAGAFRYERDYDHATFRTGGVVWVAPNDYLTGKKRFMTKPENRFPVWEVGERFRAIILHEIGHVLGFPHVSATIMDGGIYSKLQSEHEEPSRHPLAVSIEKYLSSAGVLKDLPVHFDPFAMNAVYQSRCTHHLEPLIDRLSLQLTRQAVDRIEYRFYYEKHDDFQVSWPVMQNKPVFEVVLLKKDGSAVPIKIDLVGKILEQESSLSFYSENYSEKVRMKSKEFDETYVMHTAFMMNLFLMRNYSSIDGYKSGSISHFESIQLVTLTYPWSVIFVGGKKDVQDDAELCQWTQIR